VAEHCAIVSNKSRQRAIIAACAKHASAARGELESIEAYCEEIERDILAATDPGERGDSPQTVGEVLGEILPEITARQDPNNKPLVVGVSTGILELDMAIDGGLDNAVYYIGARPAMGKTAMGCSMMLNIARGDKGDDGQPLGNGKAGVFCSFEMPKDQLAMRLLANESGIDFKVIRSQRMDPEQWRLLLAGADRLSRIPISLHYMPGMHMTKIRTTMKREFRRLERKFGAKPGIGVVDYIGLVKGDRPKGDSRENEIASISRYMTKLPKEFKCPIIGLCQLNRDLEKRPNKRPMMSDLRESGALEQDAYGLWFLYRDWVYNPEIGNENNVEIILAKNRNGTTSTVNAKFDGALTRFYSENQALYDQCDEIDAGIGGDDF
jgi:replicative DNA helicase